MKLSQRELKKAREQVNEVIAEGDDAKKRIDDATSKGEAPDSEDEYLLYLADRIRELPINQQIAELATANRIDKANLLAISNALEIESSVAGANRLRDEILKLDREIIRINKSGTPRERRTVGDLQAQKRTLNSNSGVVASSSTVCLLCVLPLSAAHP